MQSQDRGCLIGLENSQSKLERDRKGFQQEHRDISRRKKEKDGTRIIPDYLTILGRVLGGEFIVLLSGKIK